MSSIFITGAGSGLGAETARRFAAEGWRVGLFDSNEAAAQMIAQEIGASAVAFAGDVTEPQSIAHALERFCVGGRLDAVFANAGIIDMREFVATPMKRLHQMIDVNARGVVNTLQVAYPYLRATPNATAVSMSSAAAIYGVPEEAVYSASKFFVRGLTEALNIEWQRADIWVCDVMVGFVDTPLVSQASHRAKAVDLIGFTATPRDVADAVLKAVRERQVHWFVGGTDAVMQQMEALPLAARGPAMATLTGF